MLYLSFNASLHCNALSWFQRFPSLQYVICLNASVSCFHSLRRRGHSECDHVFLNVSPSISLRCFISLQCLTLVSTLSVTSTPRAHRVEVDMGRCSWLLGGSSAPYLPPPSPAPVVYKLYTIHYIPIIYYLLHRLLSAMIFTVLDTVVRPL